MPWLFLLFCNCFLSCKSVEAAPLIKLATDFTYADLIHYSDLLVDPSAKLSIEQIARGPLADNFSPAISGQPLHMDQQGVYWLRFGIDNPLPDAQVLVLNLRVHDDVTLAAYSASLQPIALEHAPLLQLLIPPQSKQLFYLRVGPGLIEIAQLQLLSLERYFSTYRIQSWLGGALQSCLFLVAIAAAFTGILRRDTACNWLAGYCSALMLFEFLYRADFTPFNFVHVLNWHYRHALLQACLLVSIVCCIRLAQCLPITQYSSITQPLPLTQRRNFDAMHPLTLLLLVIILTIPVIFFLPPLTGIITVLCLASIAQIITAWLALFSFLNTYRRELLVYALLRILTLAITVGGAFAWHTNSSILTLINNVAPIAMIVESTGIFAILLWRSFERLRVHALDEREIAVMEAEARSRTEVIAEVGHRLRTPLSGVLGMVDMLEDTSLSTAQMDYLNTIRRASSELLNAVTEISDISRLQTQSANLLQSIFDPHALVAECVDGFRSAATARQLELIIDSSPELSAYVSGDPTRVRQIILQLLHQLVGQYERGDILLNMSQPRRDWLHFEISARAVTDGSISKESDRTGHLLPSPNVRFAIARQLIEMLGGRLQIDNTSGNHLSIRFDLPLPSVERSMPVDIGEMILKAKRLLVIDDNATFCDVLERQLKHWGALVFIAHSANEGLARLRNQITLQQPIDALLIDSAISDLRHGEWLQRLHGEFAPAPIVVWLANEIISEPGQQSFGDCRTSSDCHTFGDCHTLLKPINQTSLKIVLIEAFKQRAQRPHASPRWHTEPIRCLFAEDHLINTKVLAGMLDKLGVIYTATANGQEAVDVCRRNRFDIVLMDWNMPVMDGGEASRRIREIFESRGEPPIPIIALTANTVEELGERARQLVMDAHLVKPIQLQNLREVLEQWTGKSTAAAHDSAH